MSGVNSEVGVQGQKFRIRKFISSGDVCKLDWVQKREHLMLILTLCHSVSRSASVNFFCKFPFSRATFTLKKLTASFQTGF